MNIVTEEEILGGFSNALLAFPHGISGKICVLKLFALGICKRANLIVYSILIQDK